jgi:transposase
MSERKRKSFSSEFKAKVALEAIQGIKTLNEIGQEFGVHPVQVGKWKKELQEQASSLFDAKRGPKPVDPSADPEKLYTEIGRLKVELDWLKKSQGSLDEDAKELDQRKRSTDGCTSGGSPIKL